MRTAILVHGMPDREEYEDPDQPSASNAHWLPWLQNRLLIAGIAAATPEMPLAWQPDFEIWRHEFERFAVTPDTLLVGHSCGGGFLLRWLSEHPEVRVGRVVLVAPWLDPHGEAPGFFDFSLDPGLVTRTERLTVFASDDDFESIQQTVARIRAELPAAEVRMFSGCGHFTRGDLGTDAFPELLEALVALP